MHIERVWLRGFRNHHDTDVKLDPKLTLIYGANGHGKTNLLEAIDLLSGHRSFRGAQISDLICVHQPEAEPSTAQKAQVLAEVERQGRKLEVELLFTASPGQMNPRQTSPKQKSTAMLNRNPVKRLSDLAEALQTVVFTPADLALVQGSPSGRRQLLDNIAEALSREYRQRKRDFDKVLRHRNALLKQSRSRLDADAERTLEIWDSQLIECAEVVGEQRAKVVAQLDPREVYLQLAATAVSPPGSETDAHGTRFLAGNKTLALDYLAPWRANGLGEALKQSRREDLRRGTTTVGPQRDDVAITLDSLPAATHSSQGEQRSAVLALRLAQHRMLTEALNDPPVILLDDVFSELDNQRAQNLIDSLPECQIVITSATGAVPPNITVNKRIELQHGAVVE